MKRSSQVGLVLMSALGVGGTAYMLMPGRDCRPPDPDQPALHAPLAPGGPAAAAASPDQNCAPRGSSGSGRSGGGSSWWHRGSSTSSSGTRPVAAAAGATASRPATTSSSGFGTTLRNGFGSFARAVSSGG